MPKANIALPCAAFILAAALAVSPAGAKSSGSSHSSSHSSSSHHSSSHSTSHTTTAPRPPTTVKSTVLPNGTRITDYPKGKSSVVHACKTKSCMSKHPTGYYYYAR